MEISSIVWCENSAQLRMIEEPGRMIEVLRARIRPLASKDLPPGD